jgi:hypothetical protein
MCMFCLVIGGNGWTSVVMPPSALDRLGTHLQSVFKLLIYLLLIAKT